VFALLALWIGLLSSDWQTYHDATSGYTVEYPADWSVAYDESETRFTSPSGRVGIIVVVTDSADADAPDATCAPTPVAGLPAISCQDILTFSIWTTIVDGNRAYTIATSSKNYDAQAYKHVVESFSP
jgi:hypothetical protein